MKPHSDISGLERAIELLEKHPKAVKIITQEINRLRGVTVEDQSKNGVRVYGHSFC